MTQTANCPHCKAKFYISAEMPTKDEPGFIGRLFGPGRMDSQATQHFGQSIAPALPQRPTTEPGTINEIDYVRPETINDVMVHGLRSVMYGFATSALSTLAFLVEKWDTPWYVPFVAFLPAAGAAWFIVSGRARGLTVLAEKITNLDLDGDGKVGDDPKPQTVTLVSRVQTMDGTRSIEIPTEITNVNGFLSLCRAVHYDKKNFSVAEAERHKVDGREMAETIRRWAQDNRLIDSASVGKGKTIVLTHGGRAMVKQYAQTPLLTA